MKYSVSVMFTVFGRVVVEADSPKAAEAAVEAKAHYHHHEVTFDTTMPKVDTVIEGETEVAE